MKYIIMCGANTQPEGLIGPRQLSFINGEALVDRTIRILKELRIDDKDIWITVSTKEDEEIFAEHWPSIIFYPEGKGVWVNCFYRGFYTEPRVYLLGDVYYSYSALIKIVECNHTDIHGTQFFASTKGPLHKEWAEPFAFKVWDVKMFFSFVDRTKVLYQQHHLYRCISWELWQVIKGTTLNKIVYTNYIPIDDYSCDVDSCDDIRNIESLTKGTPIMIHAVPERLWYVHGYLIPSLEAKDYSNVTVWCDWEHKGNLEACLESFLSVGDKHGGTWHLQDDVVIGEHSVFDEHYTVTCGFGSQYDIQKIDIVSTKDMWLSFPCIWIPNDIAKLFVGWVKHLAINDPRYSMKIHENRYDDYLFKEYMKDIHKNTFVINMTPNLVDHVDWLIGGSVCNEKREDKIIRSMYWPEDDNSVEELAKKLEGKE